jgi:hypothetical protein
MNRLGRLLSALAVMGLALLPFARPTMALPAATHEAMHHHAPTGLPHDHNCCPKQAPAFQCDGDCLAICAAQALYHIMQVPSLAYELGLAARLVPHNDAGPDGLKERPPPRPPKI